MLLLICDEFGDRQLSSCTDGYPGQTFPSITVKESSNNISWLENGGKQRIATAGKVKGVAFIT